MKPMPPPGSRVAFYSRYSTNLQSYSSIEGQERLCEAFAAKQQWEEAGRYADAECSGTTTYGRTGYFEMLLAASRGEFEVLLIEDIDRASRDAADTHLLVKQLDEFGVTLCTVASGVVTDIELAFKAVQNQQFIQQNSAKAKRGQEQVIASGRMSGSIAYGYEKVQAFDARGEQIRGLRRPNPLTAPVVQRIHADFDAEMTTFEICKKLNEEGVPGPKGKGWRPGALLGNRNGGLGILRNPIYIGELQFRKTQRKRRQGKIAVRFTGEAERMIVQHPDLAIIDRALWDRNQARLAENSDRPFHTKKKVEYVFTGKVFCGRCGNTCIVNSGKFLCTGHNHKGVCDNTRRTFRTVLESSIFSRIKDHLLTSGVLDACLTAYREEEERAVAAHGLQVQADRSRADEIDTLVGNLSLQMAALDAVSFASQALAEQINRLGLERTRIAKRMKSAPRRPRSPDDRDIVGRIATTADNLQAALEGDDREAHRARELLRGLVDRIVLTPTPDAPSDGRGAGDVTVSVEGPLAALIDLADFNIDRVAKDGHRPMSILDNETSVWSFTFVIPWENPRLDQVRADLPVIARLLDHADVPVSMDAFVTALIDQPPLEKFVPIEVTENGEVRIVLVQEAAPVNARLGAMKRVRNAVGYLLDRHFIRGINTRTSASGYVWNDRGISDEAWMARIANRPMTQTIPVIRLSAPTAIPVVVGPRPPSADTDDDASMAPEDDA